MSGAKNMSVAPITAATEAPAHRGRKPRDPNAPKQTRAPAAPKRIYAVVQMFDDEGQPVLNAKGKVKIVSFERSAEKVLEVIDGGKVPGALYLSGDLPPGR